MVMEYMEHDFKALFEHNAVHFSQGEVKCLLKQLLLAVHYLHDNWVIHRYTRIRSVALITPPPSGTSSSPTSSSPTTAS
jgi:serine/threonine protein kinase